MEEDNKLSYCSSCEKVILEPPYFRVNVLEKSNSEKTLMMCICTKCFDKLSIELVYNKDS